MELAEPNYISVKDLSARQNLVILIATRGEGLIPQNAQTLSEELGRVEASTAPLAGVKYSVFALGDKAYRHFCSAGKGYDVKLAELGASPLLDMGIGDDQDEDKVETGCEQWLPAWLDEGQAPPEPGLTP